MSQDKAVRVDASRFLGFSGVITRAASCFQLNSGTGEILPVMRGETNPLVWNRSESIGNRWLLTIACMTERLPIHSPRAEHPRNRLRYAVLALGVIVAGLLWRSRYMPLPPFFSKYGGDALWALMVFVWIGFILPRASTCRVAVLALAFAWGVEFSQLYHAPWLDSLRATLPGRLILGSTFNWPDLPAYALGIILGALLEHRAFRATPAGRVV